MKITIHKMSHYAEMLLKSSHTGAVHSVYRKTVNLSINNELLALQAKASPLSPISLITDLSSSDMSELGLNPGNPVRFSEAHIDIHSSSCIHHISYSDARRYDLLLSASLNDGGQKRLIQSITTVLTQNTAGGFDLIFNNAPDSSLSLTLLAAKKHMADGFYLYRKKEFKKAAASLVKVLGLGTGLTPSGDDFLCGVLAGLKLSGQQKNIFSQTLKSEISRHLTDTVDISAAFLSCALKDQYSMAVNDLSSCTQPENIAGAFSAIGHSSGMDTLCGVLYALALKNVQ